MRWVSMLSCWVAHARMTSAILKSSVNHTLLPVLVPVPRDVVNEATTPPAEVISLMAGPRSCASPELLPGPCQENITEPFRVVCFCPTQSCTCCPSTVTLPVASVGQLAGTGGIRGSPTVVGVPPAPGVPPLDVPPV